MVNKSHDFVIGQPNLKVNQIKKVQYFNFFCVIVLSEEFQKMFFFKYFEIVVLKINYLMQILTLFNHIIKYLIQ